MHLYEELARGTYEWILIFYAQKNLPSAKHETTHCACLWQLLYYTDILESWCCQQFGEEFITHPAHAKEVHCKKWMRFSAGEEEMLQGVFLALESLSSFLHLTGERNNHFHVWALQKSE